MKTYFKIGMAYAAFMTAQTVLAEDTRAHLNKAADETSKGIVIGAAAIGAIGGILLDTVLWPADMVGRVYMSYKGITKPNEEGYWEKRGL